MNARYCVIIVETSPEYGFVVRRMLVARFVAKGDAIAYAKHRRDTATDHAKDWTWVVETVNANRSLHEFPPLATGVHDR